MGTYSSPLLPNSTGLDLGSSSQRWDAFIKDLNVSGTAAGFIVTDPTADQTINAHNLLPTASNPSITGQSLGTSAAAWQESYINLKVGNAIRYADQFAGATADVQINAAIADLPSTGGVVDARGFGATNQTIAAPVLVGSAGKPVDLILNRNTQFLVTVVGAVDAIQVYTGSSLVALGNTNSVPNYTFGLSSSASVSSVVATYPRNGNWIGHIEGITLQGNATATVSSAMLDLIGPVDISTLREVLVWNFTNTIGIRLRNATSVTVGPINFDNCSVNGSGNTGARPVVIDGTNAVAIIDGVNFLGGSYTHPGTGSPIFEVQGGGGGGFVNQVQGIHWYGTQVEPSNASDVGFFLNNVTDALLSGVVGTFGGTAGTDLVKIDSSGTGVSYNIHADNVLNFNAFTNTLNDVKATALITDQHLAHWVMIPTTDSSYQVVQSNGGGYIFKLLNSNKSAKFAGQVQLDSTINRYNSINLVGNGISSEVAAVDLTAQTAAITTSTLYAVPSSGAGQYRLSWNAKVTTPATTGAATSTLGALTVVYTDPDGVAQTITAAAQIAAGTIATTSTANTTAAVLLGLPMLLNCKASTNITYAMAYASNTANQMAFNIHIKLEAL